MKYVFVTGGVVSSLGKGITASSLGRLLKARGFKVSMQKMDPYLNMDPGLLSPMQHGEAFITDDGVAADLDLGHYERFVDCTLRGEASVTTGKLHAAIMRRELAGEYRGGTIQTIPHVTNEIKERIQTVASNAAADIAIVEIGGTAGDMECAPYLEAIRQLRWEVGGENCCFIHVTLIPYIAAAGELKTKPTQHSVIQLRSIGIQPDVLVCRTDHEITQEMKNKVALFCNVSARSVVQNRDAECLYAVPLMLEKEGLADAVTDVLRLGKREPDLAAWERIVDRFLNPKRRLRVAMVGKYVDLHDAYLSVVEALTHAAIAHSVAVDIEWIQSANLTPGNIGGILGHMDAIVLPGGYGERGAEGIILAARYARENNVPCLCIGFGMQLAVVEAARNLAGMAGANSTEVSAVTPHPVVYVPEERVAMARTRNGSRNGAQQIRLEPGSRIAQIYGAESISERHGNRNEISPTFLDSLMAAGLRFPAREETQGFVEAFEVPANRFYMGVIYHPEYKSRPDNPHPLFDALIAAAMKK
ncbi:MAG: CTP synthase [Clostridia bacterium]|nr:CTP synthase [Clostridia bacterium]